MGTPSERIQMRSDNLIANRNQRAAREIALSVGLILLWVLVLLLLTSMVRTANAQTVTNPSTTTSLWAGTADPVADGFSSFTLPASGVILQGTAISAITGKPVRHLWYGDAVDGICRIDPEVDDVIPPTAGIGGHFTNVTTCFASISKPSPIGPLTFDASTNTLYIANTIRNGLGVVRIPYVPSGDNGQGSLDLVHATGLIGTQSTSGTGGCAQVKDPKTSTLVPVTPDALALGPDGNLYVGDARDGAIIRIIGPATFNPATDCPGGANASGVSPGPNDKIQIPILSTDEQVGSGHTFGLGWIGHTLFGGDNTAPWLLANADQCFTSVNGNRVCASPALGGAAPMPSEFLASLVGAPQGAGVSDAQFPTSAGSTMYFATFSQVSQLTNVASATNLTVATNYGGTFNFITGLTVDPNNSQTLYVSVDPCQGCLNGGAAIYQVTQALCPPGAVPLPPTGVTGLAGNSQAALSWTPAGSCSQASNYVVRTLFSGGAASGVPDFTIGPGANGIAPTTATIAGLTNGNSYQFEVEACNATGCSAFSALSNIVSLNVPATPAGVTASVASATSANVAWTSPLDANSYTVSAFDSLAPTVVAASVGAPGDFCARLGCGVHSTTVSGLISSHTYTFTVHATNLVGSSPESAPSLPATLPPSADLSITMSAPATIPTNGVVTFAMSITNAGPQNAFQVTISDALPANATFTSFTSSQGICASAAGSFTCNLGTINAGGSAVVTLTLQAAANSTSITDSAAVSAFDSTGAAIADPNTANNTATATILPTPPAVSTDIQVVGAAQNGGPAVNSTDTLTWQIKDNQGTINAPGVVFTSTLPSNFVFGSVTSTQGACSNSGNTITCNLGTVSGGATATVIVNFNVGPTPGTFSTAGTASFNGTDTNPANNSFAVTIQPK